MVLPQFKARVGQFLATLRLGVDFGETAGGIALVKNNSVLHAETYVDFAEATLETRRTLRRGRRTRSAKKMRLARLRSWILRQKLPDGTRLPDPYPIMRNRKFQTKPGLFEQKGKAPSEFPTWIEAAKAGAVDASGFVCALTHLFQKRGYKYDDKELGEFNEPRLIDFLNSCCILERATELAEKMRAEVDRRHKPKLTTAFAAALTRQPEPRKAVPRQIKEEDLRTMVAAFARIHGLPQETTTRWQKELCGLLNRVLREARFDNRLKSGCTWCGKKTARLKKDSVRELAYLAAVSNLRIFSDDQNRKTRPLLPEERARFVDWWRLRQLFREGKHEFRKGPKVSVFERAPTEENIEKAFNEMRVEKRWLRDSKSKPYFGYPMLSQMNNLLNHIPRHGRASLCQEHLRMAAEGKSMKHAGVPWHKLRVRNAPNPCREQHDARVLRRIERLLFRRGKKGAHAWRHGPISYITLEVPDPNTERVESRHQTQRQPLSLREVLHKETGGVCVYQHTAACRARHGEVAIEFAEKDHIVPKHRGGPDVRLNLVYVCHDCNHPDTGKGHKLPSEWMGFGSVAWKEFEARVRAMTTINEAKKNLLLLEPNKEFPEDETPLAHVGARPRAFVAELVRLFERYDVTPPTLEYKLNVPHVQRVNGKWTQDLRKFWMWKDRDAKQRNFPPKNRADLFNHAEDAALLAATPPHTWRKLIAIDRAIRPCAKRDKDGSLIRDEQGRVQTEMRQRPIALLDLAPDWDAFMADRKKPIVVVLGKLSAGWKRQMMDQSFYQDPQTTEDAFLRIRKPVANGGMEGKQRRQTVRVPKGGLLIRVPYTDHASGTRRFRKVQVKPIGSTAAVFWRDNKGKFKISLERPTSIRDFVKLPIDPPVPQDAVPAGRWARGATVRLAASNGFPEGFYRVKELAENGVIVIPENNVTAAIAERLGLPREEVNAVERRVGKTELARLFPGT